MRFRATTPESIMSQTLNTSNTLPANRSAAKHEVSSKLPTSVRKEKRGRENGAVGPPVCQEQLVLARPLSSGSCRG